MRAMVTTCLGLALGLGSCGGSTATPDAAATSDAATTPSDQLIARLAGKRILWIGAHPDDESTIAPILGEACVDQHAVCSFLVLTRGESGNCARLDGCLPDLVTVRMQELAAAAQIYGATVLQGSLPDGAASDPAGVIAAWTTAAGGTDALVRSVTEAIASAHPDVIVTFDARHGTTCHPDHRAAGALVQAGLTQLGAAAPDAYVSEARLDGTAETSFGFVAVVPDDARAIHYDANRVTAGAGGATWNYVLKNLAAHASQFTPAQIAAFMAAPAAARSGYLLPAAEATGADARYDGLCP
ncbi:MAG: PIG-L family deacetylase [Deltaproteobacteria bacterium]|nr:PIG-L family deacetylase [Deltaproteobacteria bacterium]